MKQYLDAVRHVLDYGTRKENRTGVDTLSVFGLGYHVDLARGFPLLTTKEVSWRNIAAELLWFLSGYPDIGILKRHGCKFWDAWADENGKVPSAYGAAWRHFPTPGQDSDLGVVTSAGSNDQLAWAVEELKRNPMSRRVVISAWAPGNAQTSKLPPCHCMFILNVQNLPACRCACHSGDPIEHLDGGCCPNKYAPTDVVPLEPHLCLHLTQRSCDLGLGVPYNTASYALLLHLMARFTGLKPGIFHHTLVDAHIYTAKPDGSMAEYDHVPGLREQLTREPRELPRLLLSPDITTLGDIIPLLEADTAEVMRHFVLEGYRPWPAISFKVAV